MTNVKSSQHELKISLTPGQPLSQIRLQVVN